MKILYELNIDCDQKFNASDFPDTIEVLRAGKEPFVFHPVAIQTQDLYGRLKEAESLLLDCNDQLLAHCSTLKTGIDEYFERNKQ